MNNNCCMISKGVSKEYVPSCLDCKATVYPCETQDQLTCSKSGLCNWENDMCKRAYPYTSEKVSSQMCSKSIDCNSNNKENTLYAKNNMKSSAMQSAEAPAEETKETEEEKKIRLVNVKSMYQKTYDEAVVYVFLLLLAIFASLLFIFFIIQWNFIVLK